MASHSYGEQKEDKEIIVLIGTQGAGKSTYSRDLEKRVAKHKRIGKDDIRELLFHPQVKFDDHSHLEILVTQIQNMQVEAAILLGLTPIIDNNNHTKNERMGLLWHLRYHYPNCRIVAHYIYAPIALCLERNKQRPGKAQVPEDIVIEFNDKMKNSFGDSDDPTWVPAFLREEGFDDVHVVNPEAIAAIRLANMRLANVTH